MSLLKLKRLRESESSTSHYIQRLIKSGASNEDMVFFEEKLQIIKQTITRLEKTL